MSDTSTIDSTTTATAVYIGAACIPCQVFDYEKHRKDLSLSLLLIGEDFSGRNEWISGLLHHPITIDNNSTWNQMVEEDSVQLNLSVAKSNVFNSNTSFDAAVIFINHHQSKLSPKQISLLQKLSLNCKHIFIAISNSQLRTKAELLYAINQITDQTKHLSSIMSISAESTSSQHPSLHDSFFHQYLHRILQ